jgi:hypothetical protein
MWKNKMSAMLPRQIDFMLVIFLSIFLCSCNPVAGNNEEDDIPSISTRKESTGTNSTVANAKKKRIPGFAFLSSSLVMEEGGRKVPAKRANVTVQGHPEYEAQADAEGFFAVEAMVPGTYTFFAEAENNLGQKRVVRYEDVVIKGSAENILPPGPLQAPATLKGSVDIFNNPENIRKEGIKVYIPGTSFDATTDKRGNYTLTGIPAGEYDWIFFDKRGLSPGEITDVFVAPGETKNLGLIYLTLSSGPEGKITGLDGARRSPKTGIIYTQYLEPTLEIQYNSKATQMVISNRVDFKDATWIPVKNRFRIEKSSNLIPFPNKTYSIFIKFADLNGLESNLKEFRFNLDTQKPIVNGFCVFYCFNSVVQSDDGYPVSARVDDYFGEIYQ